MIALVSVSVALIALILIGTIISVAQKIKERDVSSIPGNAKEYDPAAVARFLRHARHRLGRSIFCGLYREEKRRYVR